MTEITQDTVWFKIHRAPTGGWTVSKRTPSNIYQNRPPGWWGGDFATKQEAIDHGLSQGWILVQNWGEAKRQVSPFFAARMRQAEQFHEARKGRRQIRLENAEGKYVTRYVRSEVADELIAQLADADEFGIVS